jgi:competence CoiA-like predicted nuclease
MLIAITENNSRSKVQRKGQRGHCPKCGSEVIAKCGQVNTWHWAHKVKQDCDWYSSESEWHREWKSLFPSNKVEVYMNRNRADAIDATGCVWEFQNSYLGGEEIDEREQVYENLLWIWNVKGQQKLITFDKYIQDISYEVNWYNLRYEMIYDEGSKKFTSYWEANDFSDKMKSYGWKVNIQSLHFINFQNSARYQAEDVYAEYKQNNRKSLWLYKIHALSSEPQKPKWLPDLIDGLACRFWWQHSRSIQQCKKPVILDLNNNLFFAISNVSTQNISTFTDREYGIRVQENVSFAEGYLFELSRKKLIYAFEEPSKPEQLSFL